MLFSRGNHLLNGKISIQAATISQFKKKLPINISKIYEHDLFDTYEKEAFVSTKPDYVIALPNPPAPRAVHIPTDPKPHFLEPLAIVLKGIIFVHDDDSKNRIIIADANTKHETLYKVGDMVEDAQLIKIFNKKAIFLRSNGQQEVLYLRAKDAQLDPTYMQLAAGRMWCKKLMIQRIK